jgi:hypothetical protein
MSITFCYLFHFTYYLIFKEVLGVADSKKASTELFGKKINL